MPISRDKLVKFCDDLFKDYQFPDDLYSGLEIEGKSEIKKIVTGVSLSQAFLEKAIAKKADMVILHHGIFPKSLPTPFRLTGYTKKRFELIIKNDINLMAYHLPLDAHKKIGNNVSLCNLFGLKNLELFDVGFVGNLLKPMSLEKFVEMVNDKLNVKSYVVAGGPKIAKRVGIISGGGSSDSRLAAEMGVDTYITGDIKEGNVRGSEELGINFINAGHYNTEKLGIQNLGNLIQKKFGVEVEFVDVPCDI